MSDQVPTTCVRCAVGCGHVQRGREDGYGLESVRGDPAHPTNHGLACGRGIGETANPDGEWLTRPLVRQGEDLVATTWEAAIGEAVDGLRRTMESDGEAVAVLGSGQQTNEAAYLLGKLARGGLGTPYYDANTTLCMASAVTAYYDAFGSDAPPPTYDDVPEADVHLVWGANPAAAHPVLFRWIRESAAEAGSELVVVDPVESETAEVADWHIAPDPGTDLALARAVLARAVETDRVDEAFVEAHTEGFDDLLAALPDVEDAASAAGVTPATVDLLTGLFDRRTLVYWGMGVNQSVQGTATAGALIDCCLATGNLGAGQGPFSLTGQANSMGTRVCSSKGTWPGHRDFDDPAARERVAETWGVPAERLPDDAGPGPVGIAERMAIPGSGADEAGDDGSASEDAITACYAVATNPAAGLPDAGRAREGLDETFLVVQDAFRSETVEYADVVLPAATWGESEGTVTNMERRVSRVRAATDTPPGVRSDLDLIATLGHALAPDAFPAATADSEEVFREFAGLTEGTPADCSGISYERLAGERAVRWPAPSPGEEGSYRYRTDDGWRFETPSGRARFSTAQHGGLVEPPDEEYPLTLTTAREKGAYNTGVRGRDEGLPSARLSPRTAEAHADRFAAGDDDERTVRVETRRGSLRARVTPDDRIPDGLVWLPIHHPRVNDLTLPATDPRSDEPNFKQCAARLVAPEDERDTAAVVGAPGDD